MKVSFYIFGFILIAFKSFAQNAPWLVGIGGVEQDQGASVVVDFSKNVYSAGMFGGTMDFDPGPNTTILSTTATIDGYIMKSDPNGNLLWAKNFNSDNLLFISSISLDSLDNVYVAGLINGGADLDPGNGTYTVNASGQMVFVVKLNSSGNFVWAKTVESSNSIVYIRNMIADRSGNAYLTGSFGGTTDFDPGPASYNLSANGKDGYVLKLDSSGIFVWVKKLSSSSGNDASEGFALAQDKLGNNYVTGTFLGTVDFDPGLGTYNLTSPINMNSQFILKIDISGNFIWAKKMGGSGHTVPLAITVPSSGNIYTTGYFTGTTDFDPAAATFILSSISNSGNVFVSKINASGNFVWAKSLKGTGIGTGNSMVCDSMENIYITGALQGTIDFDPGTATVSYNAAGTDDIYILKLDSMGNYTWSKAGGGIDSDVSSSITLDKNEVIYITGSYSNICDFGSISTNTLTSAGNGDIFVLKVGDLMAIGIEEFLKEETVVTLYPNPNNGTFTVKSTKDSKLNLINSLGQKIQTIKLNRANNYQETVEMLSSGIYYLLGQGELQSIKQKVVISK